MKANLDFHSEWWCSAPQTLWYGCYDDRHLAKDGGHGTGKVRGSYQLIFECHDVISSHGIGNRQWFWQNQCTGDSHVIKEGGAWPALQPCHFILIFQGILTSTVTESPVQNNAAYSKNYLSNVIACPVGNICCEDTSCTREKYIFLQGDAKDHRALDEAAEVIDISPSFYHQESLHGENEWKGKAQWTIAAGHMVFPKNSMPKLVKEHLKLLIPPRGPAFNPDDSLPHCTTSGMAELSQCSWPSVERMHPCTCTHFHLYLSPKFREKQKIHIWNNRVLLVLLVLMTDHPCLGRLWFK